ncbi:MAG: hypothetical protein HOF01_10330 [Chloroflexi bacterium]|jgi:hypothetical protein|nr:hypothetical protein [Chloroflexota bacterium]
MSLVPFAMVLGLLVPVLGPAMDHHYADRSPAHAHVFVGEDTNIHDHSLAIHDHSSGESIGDGLSITSTSVTGSYGPLTLVGATLELLVPNFNTHMIDMQAGELTVPDNESITPLNRPPRRV